MIFIFVYTFPYLLKEAYNFTKFIRIITPNHDSQLLGGLWR